MLLIRAGMVLANIRTWKDFIISRDSGLVAKEAVKYKTKTCLTETSTKEIISKEIVEKE